MSHTAITSELLQPSNDLVADMKFLEGIGFQLLEIFPSDDPAVAVMDGHGMRIRLDKSAECAAATINIRTDDASAFDGQKQLDAPNGMRVQVRQQSFQLDIPTTQHKFEVRRLLHSDPWVIGRAGMLYRDLIPDRLGGSIIASHIRVPAAGPVPDMVHYHTIGFQLIFCYKGWVKLVYEDQGPPFILHAGDCLIQPPEIRHRVLESSGGLEVIEVGVPAEHMTTIDHALELPTPNFNPEREFQGQRFCHHKLNEATWKPWRIAGFDYRETGISEATKGVAGVQVARANGSVSIPKSTSHNVDILFTFVLQGSMELSREGQEPQTLQAGDAFVMPPSMTYQLMHLSDDLELLEVALPGVSQE